MLFVHYCSVYIYFYIYIHLDILIAFKIEMPKHTMARQFLHLDAIPQMVNSLVSLCAVSGYPRGWGISMHQVVPSARSDLKKKWYPKKIPSSWHSHHFSKWGHFSPLPPEVNGSLMAEPHLGVKAIKGTLDSRRRRICLCPEQVCAEQGDGYSITYQVSVWEIQQAQGRCSVLTGIEHLKSIGKNGLSTKYTVWKFLHHYREWPVYRWCVMIYLSKIWWFSMVLVVFLEKVTTTMRFMPRHRMLGEWFGRG